ncbi:glycerophosphodiester phosphodiesterase [Bacillus glycinifermentans]|uniref:Glycerophosphodiester phosphodiesterase n=1 Tax=Bacillus glycinifermentans TaxID=1664069 RepID=A0A0J6EKU7_9BACI|nr:glycerophosphodiester phosphodiesterase family protein [Bacillus glycinifermentans]ATH93753.1 glycerophosphodiester phosphodiesterase [Bacillus glycinifermentans]KMM59515.1 glycerophosphodiester phosphodiesterase [Bacillus glycinifermentans]KRT90071.1 glycerophosphodiester phosphodiesterase [Bacillus glycinifermentans]MEC0483753.1 glycerophosphodiester phosphodiesterase family protein [Bacillus glycinifermentans]MEC0496248.1 glycerophosphodiester phosphodiesterase family protein [Bacillus g
MSASLKKVVLFLLVGITLGSLLLTPNARAAKPHKVDVIAHRGASGYAPENTVAAFDKARKMKADYIELDVQMSRDGKLVVIHDTTVNRTTDIDSKAPVKVKDLTLKELCKLDAGSYFGPQFTGERIPTFEKVLDRYKGKIGLLIELKEPALYPGIEEKVAAALKKRKMDKPKNGKVIVQSFDFNSVRRIHELLPSVPTGVLTSRPSDLTDAKLNEFAGYANYVNAHLGNVAADPTLVGRIHALGMKITPWTVRSRDEVPPLLQAGVDGIVTDYPDYVPKKIR